MTMASIVLDGAGVLNVLLSLLYIALPLIAIWRLRSVASGVLVVAVAVGVSGALVQFVGGTWMPVTLPILQVWLLATLAAAAAWAWFRGRRPVEAASRRAVVVSLSPVAAIAFAFFATRILAPGAPGPLTSVGYLISRTSAEDNAKWLNAASELTQGVVIDSWANVGGPLLLLLTVAATILSSLSTVLYGAVNEVAVSAGSPIMAEILLVMLSPLALSPMVESVWRRSKDGVPRPVPTIAVLLGITTIASASAVLLAFGHLTLQFVLIALTLWVGAFFARRRELNARVLAVIFVITTAEVWFPLNVLALGLLVALLGWSTYGVWRSRKDRTHWVFLATGLLLLVLLWDFLTSSINYSLGLSVAAPTAVAGSVRGIATANVPSLPLFASGGGTEVVSPLLAVLTLACLIGAVLVLRRSGTTSRGQVLAVAPVILLVAYAMVVTLADFWSVGSGPNYGSSKLLFAVVIPILAATIPVAPLAIDPDEEHVTLLRGIGLAGIAVLLIIDTLLPRALVQLKPNLWPTTATDPQPYWWPAEVRPTGTQPLSGNPVGCVYLPQGATKPSALPNGQLAYSCTRLLTGVAGQETELAALVEWQLTEWLQNRSLWNDYSAYFTQLPDEARVRRLILLDENGKVVGMDSLQSLINRFPPTAEVSTS